MTVMRYPAGHKEHSRERIVDAAARLFRTRGITATGIDAVMADVGLTAGAFYAHFKSKQALVGEVVRKSFVEGRPRVFSPEDDDRKWIQGVLRRYVSRAHRDEPETACPLTTLISELPRAGEAVQPIVAEELELYAGLLEEKLEDGAERTAPTRRQRALGLCAMMVGAVALSRVLGKTKLSDEVLSATRAAAASLIEPPVAR
jgi:TetR/AcrR family transcriptional repressor of nem operon